MSYEESVRSITLEADVSVGFYTGIHNQPGAADPHSGKQYHFVTITAATTVGLSSAAGGAIGVLQNKPQGVGHAATVGIRGVSNVMSGGAITAGDEVEVDADGAGVTQSAGVVVGTAIETCAGTGFLVPVLLK